jgi:hypothetical protein
MIFSKLLWSTFEEGTLFLFGQHLFATANRRLTMRVEDVEKQKHKQLASSDDNRVAQVMQWL